MVIDEDGLILAIIESKRFSTLSHAVNEALLKFKNEIDSK